MATLSELQQALIDYTSMSSAVLTSGITTECVNTALRELQREHNWRGQQAVWEFVYPANADNVALPLDFITEITLSQVTSTAAAPSDRQQVFPRITRQQWLAGNPAVTSRDSVFPQIADPSQTPGVLDKSYYLWQDALYLVPTPNADLTLVLDYYRQLPEVSTAVSTNWLTLQYPDLVRTGALVYAYQFLHEEERAAAWLQQYRVNLAKATTHDKQLSQGNGPLNRGV